MELEICGQKGLEEKVRNADLCTGCGACVDLCPYHVFYHDHTIALHGCDMKEGRCWAFCPRTPTDMVRMRKERSSAEWTPELGPILEYHIVRAADESIRDNAQHGGTVTALMSLALEEGLIDTAVVAEEDGALLMHGASVKSAAGIRAHGKSRFLVSPTVAAFHRAAKGDARKIGVVATPCQVFALGKMRMKPLPDRDSNIDKLELVIGLFCGWTLSWKPFLDRISQELSIDEVIAMEIPPGKKVLEVYGKGKTVTLSSGEVKHLARQACRYCMDTTAEFSDISVGSARLPDPWEVTRYWNQVIVRTLKGKKLMDRAFAKGVVERRDVPKGVLEELKGAARSKKKAALKNLAEKSGRKEDLIYLDADDPVIRILSDQE